MAFVELSLSEITDGHLLSNLEESHLQTITEASQTVVHISDETVRITGREKSIPKTEIALRRIARDLSSGAKITGRLIDSALRYANHDPAEFKQKNLKPLSAGAAKGGKRSGNVLPRTDGQALYLQALDIHEMVVGLGPAGTGKTFLAVAKGLAMLERREVAKLIITRPAVEAGEKLGFLPGDLKEKVDPYLRPIYDAIWELAGSDALARMLKDETIEVAPLAFMRGRTLAHAYCLLDEAQNTTAEQMKMFITRLGEGSRMVIAGDPDQVDLPRGVQSGLVAALPALKRIPEIGIVQFDARDVVRHPLVGKVVQAYADIDTERLGQRD